MKKVILVSLVFLFSGCSQFPQVFRAFTEEVQLIEEVIENSQEA